MEAVFRFVDFLELFFGYLEDFGVDKDYDYEG